VPRASAALQLRARIFRVIPPASAAIHARASSGPSVADVIVAAVGARTAVADVPIAADVPARDSNAGLAGALGKTAVIVAIPVRRDARNSSPKC
jgi:hypothetical protein